MKDVYVLGVVEGTPPVFRYLSVHVSRNKAFVTARQMAEEAGTVEQEGNLPWHGEAYFMRMYEHEAGDRLTPGHFYLYRTALGEILKDVGGGSQTENDQSILVVDYKVGMQRERVHHEPNDERIVISQPEANEEGGEAVD